MEDRDWEEELQLRRDAMALWAAMVAERNLPPQFIDTASAYAIEEALKGLTHVRLDREHILLLEPAFFLCLRNLSSLYLQENDLTTLNGVETAKQLQFLTVSGNQLTSLQGLQALPKLAFLDASNNCISRIDPDSELPKSIYFLNVSQNPCCKLQNGLEETLSAALPNLKELRTSSEVRTGSETRQTSTSNVEEQSIREEPKPISSDDVFINVLERSLQNLGLKKQPNRTTNFEEAQQNTQIEHIIDMSAQQALHDAGMALMPILDNTREQVQHNFDKIQQRSQLRVLEEEQENGWKKKIRKPTIKKPSLRQALDFM